MKPVDPKFKPYKYTPPKRFTENYEEYREAIRINNRIWSKFYNQFYAQGHSRDTAATMARENVARFRQRYPFPAFLVGVNHEKSKQDESTGGLVLGGVSKEGTSPEQVLATRLSNASVPVQVRSNYDEVRHASGSKYARVNEILKRIRKIA